MKKDFNDLRNELTDYCNLFIEGNEDNIHNKIKSLGDLLFEKFKRYSVKK
jgi:hypothetical protein